MSMKTTPTKEKKGGKKGKWLFGRKERSGKNSTDGVADLPGESFVSLAPDSPPVKRPDEMTAEEKEEFKRRAKERFLQEEAEKEKFAALAKKFQENVIQQPATEGQEISPPNNEEGSGEKYISEEEKAAFKARARERYLQEEREAELEQQKFQVMSGPAESSVTVVEESQYGRLPRDEDLAAAVVVESQYGKLPRFADAAESQSTRLRDGDSDAYGDLPIANQDSATPPIVAAAASNLDGNSAAQMVPGIAPRARPPVSSSGSTSSPGSSYVVAYPWLSFLHEITALDARVAANLAVNLANVSGLRPEQLTHAILKENGLDDATARVLVLQKKTQLQEEGEEKRGSRNIEVVRRQTINVRAQLASLKARKLKAVESEDFPAAQKLKAEIDELEGALGVLRSMVAPVEEASASSNTGGLVTRSDSSTPVPKPLELGGISFGSAVLDVSQQAAHADIAPQPNTHKDSVSGSIFSLGGLSFGDPAASGPAAATSAARSGPGAADEKDRPPFTESLPLSVPDKAFGSVWSGSESSGEESGEVSSDLDALIVELDRLEDAQIAGDSGTDSDSQDGVDDSSDESSTGEEPQRNDDTYADISHLREVGLAEEPPVRAEPIDANSQGAKKSTGKPRSKKSKKRRKGRQAKPRSIPGQCGWAWKRGHVRKNWKRRWITVHENTITYSKGPGLEAINVIDVLGGKALSSDKRKNCIALHQPPRPITYEPGYILYMAFKDPKETGIWKRALERAVGIPC